MYCLFIVELLKLLYISYTRQEELGTNVTLCKTSESFVKLYKTLPGCLLVYV